MKEDTATRPAPASVARFARPERRTLLAYGLSGLPFNWTGSLIGVHIIIFYTDVAGLDPFWIGFGMIAATLWGAVGDPLMGVLSDRTRWRWGRRRPYIALGLVPFAGSYYLLLTPPAALEGTALGLYFAIAMILFYTFRAVIETPIASLAPEIAQDYDQRTRLGAYREFLGNLGDGIGLLLPLLAMAALVGGLEGVEAAPGMRQAFRVTGLAGAGVAVAALTICYRGTYEDPSFRRDLRVDWRTSLRAVLRNRPFLILLAAVTLVGMGLTIVNGIFLYVMRYLVQVNDRLVEAQAFALYIAGALASYPFWIRLSARWGKPAAFRVGLFTSSLVFVSVFVLNAGNLVLLYCVMVFAGIANVGVWMMAFTLNADVIDVDELQTGIRREGLYLGFATMIRKAAIALGAGSVGIGLGLVGFEPNQVQTPQTALGIKLLFCVPPTLLVLAAYLLFRRFPLTRERHRELMAQIALRRIELGVAHPDEETGVDQERG